LRKVSNLGGHDRARLGPAQGLADAAIVAQNNVARERLLVVSVDDDVAERADAGIMP
jgi:hypothetical protein